MGAVNLKKLIIFLFIVSVITGCSNGPVPEKGKMCRDTLVALAYAPAQVKNCTEFFELVNYDEKFNRKAFQDSFIAFDIVKSLLHLPIPENDSSIRYVKCSASMSNRLKDTYDFRIEYYTHKHYDSVRYVGPVFVDKNCKMVRYLLKNRNAGEVLDFYVQSDSMERAYIGDGMPDGYTMKDYFAEKEKYKNKKRR